MTVELRHLDAFCGRALHDEDAEPSDAERPAVERYERLLAERARDWGRVST